jgi:hypothetical protein
VLQGWFGVYDFDLTHGVVVKDYLQELWAPAAVGAGAGAG